MTAAAAVASRHHGSAWRRGCLLEVDCTALTSALNRYLGA